MRCLNCDITKLPTRQPSSPEGTSYNMHIYVLPIMLEDKCLVNHRLNIIKDVGSVGKIVFSVKGLGCIKPVYSRSDVCLAGLRRIFSSKPAKGKEHKYSYIITEFDKPSSMLPDKVINDYYNIVKRMGLVSSLTSKANFIEYMVNIVDATKHSMFYLYVTMSVLRSIRDDHMFVKYFVDMVKKGLDPYAAYVAMSVIAHNSGHHIINRPYTFGGITWNESISPSWIHGIYNLFKLGEHTKLTPINNAEKKSFDVHSILKDNPYNNGSNIGVGSMIKYGNTLAASIKRTCNKEHHDSTVKIIREINRECRGDEESKK